MPPAPPADGEPFQVPPYPPSPHFPRMLPLFTSVNVLQVENVPLAVNAGVEGEGEPIVTHALTVTDADNGLTWSQPAVIAAARKS